MTLTTAGSGRRGSRVHLLGYYGYRNLGDDLMLDRLLGIFSLSENIASVDISAVADLALDSFPHVQALVTRGIRGRLAKAWSIARSDVVVWGGGTCLYEAGPGGTQGLRGIAKVMRLTHATAGKYVMLGVGIGEIHTDEGRRLLSNIVRSVDGIYCRDVDSVGIVNEICGYDKARTCGDLSLLNWHPSEDKRAPRVEPRHVVFCGTHEQADSQELIKAYTDSARGWLAAGVGRVTFLPFHQGTRSDHAFHERIVAGLPTDRVTVASYDRVEQAESILASADVVVAFRLHASVVACMRRTPFLAVNYSPKVKAFVAKAGLNVDALVKDLGAPIDVEDLRVAMTTANEQGAGAFLRSEAASAEAAVEHFIGEYCCA